ncbi:thioredoxin family protein [Sphingobacterium hungaricum]
MRKLFLMFFLLPLFALSQESGIHFEHSKNWNQVVAKAKAENKYIFVDAFTTWCGPCKWMAANIFPQQQVGEFFNKNFVNLKLQMDQTDADSKYVKSWYDEAERFQKDYSVVAYPTFLIFNPDGELVHRIIGSSEADAFIAKAQEGLNPETQYVTLVKRYDANPNDKEIAKSMAIAAEAAYDQKLARQAQERFIALLAEDELLEKDNLRFLVKTIKSINSIGYEIVNENRAKVDELLGSGMSNTILVDAIIREKVVPQLRAKDVEVDFDALENEMASQYPDLNFSSQFTNQKVNYYFRKKNWPAFRDATNELIAESKTGINPSLLNSYAWKIFENCEDIDCIQSAIAWSKMSLERGENPAYLDTYANLLYKSGDKENALIWQEKALALVDEESKSQYQETLNKMKAGKPTWVNEEGSVKVK